MPEAQTRIITAQLLEGLNIMHRNNFTHRDLKPGNIFVVQKDPFFWVKIGDFGITKRIMNDETLLQTEIGTQAYRAPEVWGYFNEESYRYTNAVDIWSLGNICHRLLTAQPPFGSPAAPALAAYCSGSIKLPIEANSQSVVSSEGVQFVKALMNAKPSERLSADAALKSPWLEDVEILEANLAASARIVPRHPKNSTKISVSAANEQSRGGGPATMRPGPGMYSSSESSSSSDEEDLAYTSTRIRPESIPPKKPAIATANDVRKRVGFDPYSRGVDETMAPQTSRYPRTPGASMFELLTSRTKSSNQPTQTPGAMNPRHTREGEIIHTQKSNSLPPKRPDVTTQYPSNTSFPPPTQSLDFTAQYPFTDHFPPPTRSSDVPRQSPSTKPPPPPLRLPGQPAPFRKKSHHTSPPHTSEHPYTFNPFARVEDVGREPMSPQAGMRSPRRHAAVDMEMKIPKASEGFSEHRVKHDAERSQQQTIFESSIRPLQRSKSWHQRYGSPPQDKNIRPVAAGQQNRTPVYEPGHIILPRKQSSDPQLDRRANTFMAWEQAKNGQAISPEIQNVRPEADSCTKDDYKLRESMARVSTPYSAIGGEKTFFSSEALMKPRTLVRSVGRSPSIGEMNLPSEDGKSPDDPYAKRRSVTPDARLKTTDERAREHTINIRDLSAQRRSVESNAKSLSNAYRAWKQMRGGPKNRVQQPPGRL